MGFLFLFSFCSFFLSQSPDSGIPMRAPHGLANEPPLLLSPSAVEFFNPQTPLTNANPPMTSTATMIPESAVKPRATQMRESQVMVDGEAVSNHGIGAAGEVGVLFTFVFAVLLAVGGYYLFVARRRGVTRALPVKLGA